MKGDIGMSIGVVLLCIGALFLLPDVLGLDGLHIVFAVSIFGFSILSGRNIAYLFHDSSVLKRRAGNLFSPGAMVALWMFLFLLAVTIYTVMSALFFKTVGAVMAGINSSYMGLMYTTLALMGAYFVFKGASDKNPNRLYSSWGKRMEKMRYLGKNAMDRGVEMFRRSLP